MYSPWTSPQVVCGGGGGRGYLQSECEREGARVSFFLSFFFSPRRSFLSKLQRASAIASRPQDALPRFSLDQAPRPRGRRSAKLTSSPPGADVKSLCERRPWNDERSLDTDDRGIIVVARIVTASSITASAAQSPVALLLLLRLRRLAGDDVSLVFVISRLMAEKRRGNDRAVGSPLLDEKK
jgi:hypothetical protein